MFSRNLTEKEIEMIGIIEGFVREKHAHNIGHDYSHIIEVTRRAIGIAQMLPEPVDPFILVCGALFHDLGRVGVLTGAMHGIRGAAFAEQFLKASWIDKETGKKSSELLPVILLLLIYRQKQWRRRLSMMLILWIGSAGLAF